MEQRRRLAPGARKRQIADCAAPIVLTQGHLPVRFETIAAAARVSKALIHAYFPTQQALGDAILGRELQALAEAGLDAASLRAPLTEAALACAELYFAHIAARGPLIHIILRERLMRGGVTEANRAIRDRVIASLARATRRETGLPAGEAVAAVSLMLTIPEEAGRLAWSGELAHDDALALMRRLVASGVAAFLTRGAPGAAQTG